MEVSLGKRIRQSLQRSECRDHHLKIELLSATVETVYVFYVTTACIVLLANLFLIIGQTILYHSGLSKLGFWSEKCPSFIQSHLLT